MLKLKEENPNIKLVASVGGWNYNDCNKVDQANTGAFSCHIFSTIASTIADSQKHALKVIEFLRLWGFDGYDVDWEYPVGAGHNNVDGEARPDDYVNYIRFLQILKQEFEHEAENANDGRERLLLTVAVGVGKDTVDESYDIAEMNEVLDLISLMTYDMHGAWATATNFNAPLHATSSDIELKGYPLSVEWAVDYWLEKGASPDKLVLGLGTYGRGWTLDNPGQDQGAGSAGNEASHAGPITQAAGYLAYSEIEDLIQNQGAHEYWDDERKVPYIISKDGTQWIGYDNKKSLILKTDFLKSRGLRGAMFWAIELDDVTGALSDGQEYPLMNAVKTALGDYRTHSTSSVVASTAMNILDSNIYHIAVPIFAMIGVFSLVKMAHNTFKQSPYAIIEEEV
jgi:chitinase